MKTLRFRPAARSDLNEIWEHSVGHWGETQTETYIRAIQKACRELCDGVSTGLSADHVLEGCRRFPAGSHMIYFRENSAEITGIRILHQRMDVPRHI